MYTSRRRSNLTAALALVDSRTTSTGEGLV
jgi:hypothetical protein